METKKIEKDRHVNNPFLGEGGAQTMGRTEMGITKYIPDDVPILRPTTIKNEAVDCNAIPKDVEVVNFGKPVSDNIAETLSKNFFYRFVEETYMIYSPTVDYNQAIDYRKAISQGHTQICSFSTKLSCNPTALPSNPPRRDIAAEQQESSEFRWNGKILYWKSSDKEIRLADFCCCIERLFFLHGLKEPIQMLRVRYVKESESITMDIKLEDFSESNYSILRKRHPDYKLFPDCGKHLQIYQLYSSEVFEKYKNRLPWENFYKFPGWHKDGGRYHYYSAIDENCLASRRLSDLTSVNVNDVVLYGSGILKFASMGTTLPLLLQMHKGVTMQLFLDAGYHEDFVLLIIGPTGNGKSYLARSTLNYFSGNFINFESTERAIDLQLEKRIDAVCVIDDLRSGRNKELAQKLEHILRQVGDMIGKSKSCNNGTEQESVKLRCSVVITAENDVDELQLSGRLRSLAVFIKPGELINSPLLKQYHDDNERALVDGTYTPIDQYMTAYVKYLEVNYDSIVDFIRSFKVEIPPLRPRQITIYRQLAAQAWIILEFWQYHGLIKPSQAEEIYYQEWLPTLQEVMLADARRGEQADPALMFLRALAEGIASNRLPIAESKEAFENASSKIAGFWDKGILKLLPDYAFEYVTAHYAKLRIVFAETQNGLLTKLYQKGDVLDVYLQKGHKPKLVKKVSFRDKNSVSLLCLKWNAVEHLLAQVDFIEENEKMEELI